MSGLKTDHHEEEKDGFQKDPQLRARPRVRSWVLELLVTVPEHSYSQALTGAMVLISNAGLRSQEPAEEEVPKLESQCKAGVTPQSKGQTGERFCWHTGWLRWAAGSCNLCLCLQKADRRSVTWRALMTQPGTSCPWGLWGLEQRPI